MTPFCATHFGFEFGGEDESIACRAGSDAEEETGRGIAYAVLDEVLGPLRELAQRGEYAHEATYQAYMKPLSECDCGLVELRALCRELLS